MPPRPQTEYLKDLESLKKCLRQRPHTIKEVRERFDISRVTADRWLRLVGARNKRASQYTTELAWYLPKKRK